MSNLSQSACFRNLRRVWCLGNDFIGTHIIYQIGGVILVILGFFIFPITLLIAPWYEVIVNHHWFLFLLTYGPWPLCGALFAISEILEKRSAKH
jgi:hypothetical protein